MWAWSCRECGRTCYYDMTTDELVCYQCGHRRKVQRQPSPQQNVTEPLRAEGAAIGLAKGEASGLAKGEASGLAKARAWLERKAAAERAGLPFDEPFPS